MEEAQTMVSDAEFESAFEGDDNVEGNGKDADEQASGQSVSEAKAEPDGGTEPADQPEEPEPAWKAEVEKAKKVAEDNKSWGTKLAQENAELKKRLDQLEALLQESKKASEEDDNDLPEDAQEFFEDFPEAKKAVEHLAKKLAENQVKSALGDVDVKAITETIAQQRWIAEVMHGYVDDSGNFVEGHTDLMRITAPGNKDYWDWYQSKGYGPCDSREAVKRITEYKSEKLDSIQSSHKQKQRQKADQVKLASTDGLTSSRGTGGSSRKREEVTFEDAFNED